MTRKRKQLSLRECLGCGNQFTQTHGRQKHCSDDCRVELQKAKMREACRLKPKLAYVRDCKCCGERFVTVQKLRVHCSDICMNRYSRPLVRTRTKPHTLICKSCNETFDSEKETTRYCSVRCGHDARSKRAAKDRKRREPIRQEILSLRSIARKPKEYSSKVIALEDRLTRPDTNCVECGSVIPGRSNRVKFCSEFCDKRNQRRRNKLRRKARFRAARVETVDPMAVFDRDNWTCVACGIDTPRELRGTCEDNAPELDHIYPLAKGGEHSYRNTQCLCRRCNRNKSDSLDFMAG